MLRRALFGILLLLALFCSKAFAQCPLNIGFDTGTFTNWDGATGTFKQSVIDLTAQGIVNGRQTLIPRSQQLKDPYGLFSVTSPNGSNTVVQLGNSQTGAQCEQLTYTFTVPANQEEFSLIYYYAIVLEDPPNGNHTDENKPKFTAAIIDANTNQPLNCGNFNFVSISKLPGFFKAPKQNGANDVYYKDWSPVTVDLRGMAGRTLKLQFTTNDCAPGGHFGYAYIDVNQNCTSPVSGNVICNYSNSITLKAPSGFASYQWYNGKDFSTQISSNANLTITPTPALGTQYSVVIVPYPGLGCQDTVTTTIQPPENLALVTKSALSVCRGQVADLTAPSVTAGSDPSYQFNYTYDIAGLNFITDPAHIPTDGTYYLQAITPAGCTYPRAITVTYLATPTLVITNPAEVCVPTTVDITAPAVTAGSVIGSPLTYYTDTSATVPVPNPKAIAKSGTYYVKTTNPNGCYDIKPITVLIDDLPVLVTHNVEGCNTADITTAAATNGSTGNFVKSYFYDAAATQPIPAPAAITASGRYYIKATTNAGCTDIDSIHAYVYPYPQLNPVNPPGAVFPATVNITTTFVRQSGTNYYYYLDSLATNLIPDPTKIGKPGTYYIEAINGSSCSLIKPVTVIILAPADVRYDVNTFTPNGDGKNDRFRIATPVSFQVKHFRIYGSWGGLLYDTTDTNLGWDGTVNGKLMPVGTYYWVLDAYDTYTKKTIKQSGSVTLVL